MLETNTELAFGTIAELRTALLAKKLTPLELIERVLERIARDEPKLQAWVELDANAALEAARRVDVESQPLGGIPFGVKDVIDVRGFPTRYGAQWTETKAQFDAWCVAAMRAAGAIPLGKLNTTPFALADPTVTRNPWDLARTPGGSSSGSGAAVGARQIPFAFGTQTGGSTLRPAAFNGVVGLKPTVGAIPTPGVSQLGPTADCVGIICRDAADAATLFGIFEPSGARGLPASARIAVPDGFGDDEAGPQIRAAVASVLERLQGAGARVERVHFPEAIVEVERSWEVMGPYEAWAALGPALGGRKVAPRLDELLAQGATIKSAAYYAEKQLCRAGRAEVDAFLAGYDVVALPSAGPVPLLSAGSTGSPIFLRPWTVYGYPAISLPIGFDGDGMPIGLQLVGKFGQDAPLLAIARWVESTLGFAHAGPRARLDATP